MILKLIKRSCLKWITDNVKPGSALWYATPKDTQASDPIDPRVQWEDLGNDPIKASELGLKNLKVVMANLTKWSTTNADDNTYYNTSDMYLTF